MRKPCGLILFRVISAHLQRSTDHTILLRASQEESSARAKCGLENNKKVLASHGVFNSLKPQPGLRENCIKKSESKFLYENGFTAKCDSTNY